MTEAKSDVATTDELGIPEATDGSLPRAPCAQTELCSDPTLAATRGSARGQPAVLLHEFFDPNLNRRSTLPLAGPPATVAAIPVKVGRTTFDYASLSPQTAEFLRNRATRIRQGVKSTVEAICDIGVQLCGAKQMLGHGQFVQWVESECGFSLRSAQNYMRASEFAADKNATIARLPPATVYRLSAKNAPPEVVSEVMARAASGERVLGRRGDPDDPDGAGTETACEQGNESKGDRAGPPHGESSSARGDAPNGIAKANARALLNKFGRSGAVLPLGMQENILIPNGWGTELVSS
jgi:hypothetical protein